MTLNERIHCSKSPGTPGSTCISWMVALNWGERSVHCFSSSIALSKFFTYSAYILRKGVSFCRMSPIRGVDALQGGRGGDRFVPPNVRKKKKKSQRSWGGGVLTPTLTILPCASPDPGAETDCGRCEWRRCWRRCSSQRRQGTSPCLPPPLA